MTKRTETAAAVVLTDDEVVELYRKMRNDYLNPTQYPALTRLIDRVDKRVREIGTDARERH